MALTIQYEAECNCGGTYRAQTLDLTQDAGGLVVIDMDLLGDMTMRCTECSDEIWVPAVGDFIEELEQ